MTIRSELRLWAGLNLRVTVAKYIVTAATFLLLVWAGLLAYSVNAEASTPVAVLALVFGGRWQTVVVLLASAVTAQVGMRYRAKHPNGFDGGMFVVLLPQMCVLLLATLAAVQAVLGERYADGVQRSWPFILSDQLPMIALSLCYAAMMVEIALHGGKDDS